ncbi:hypothetical protein NEUTE1DRAFT_102017 [Neurospora tetrasperma FGSC 2508]|uniref:Uncharacterized protein n=1 Tax=Neurospora tetrasperma (strain FGSC 2508 / ATCC MYA-4615 / P0657) TaxID=510951 RepID=F8MQW8_NEUT8|nr:uncharacterized protein NEUTE1DRAFT_102017 [Neurospora tetrasperma FGSC 2508]EGO56748.1 hypothetical protein NEUTE1DRAFT_102017 [Neurospora tetrasperma FGSC 2508]EGZ70370.1 hypothetical protein NEUTE2DRAFT_130374 [Neurospora tetrasperma FGSC 2509]
MVKKKEVCCSNQSLCRGVPDADELREGGEEWARADTFLAGNLHFKGRSTKYSVRTAQKRGPHPTKGEEIDGGASPEQALGTAAEQRERSATCIFLPNARCTAPQRCRPTSLQVSRPVCLHREIPQPVRHQCLVYKQIARRQSTGNTVHVSVEGPGRETQQDDLCSSALESLMEDRAMDLEMVSTRCCCCCPAGSCCGQINERQTGIYCLELGHSKVNTAFLACQGMKQPLPPSPLRVPKSTQRLDDVNYKCPPPLCFTCTHVVHKQAVAVAWHQHDI